MLANKIAILHFWISILGDIQNPVNMSMSNLFWLTLLWAMGLDSIRTCRDPFQPQLFSFCDKNLLKAKRSNWLGDRKVGLHKCQLVNSSDRLTFSPKILINYSFLLSPLFLHSLIYSTNKVKDHICQLTFSDLSCNIYNCFLPALFRL